LKGPLVVDGCWDPGSLQRDAEGKNDLQSGKGRSK
jgi:hypothetical protein